MSCYEVTIVQSIQEVYRKRFVATSRQEAENKAYLDTLEGVDETWNHDTHAGQCDDEVLKAEKV